MQLDFLPNEKNVFWYKVKHFHTWSPKWHQENCIQLLSHIKRIEYTKINVKPILLIGYCDDFETNAETEIRNHNFARNGTISWGENVIFSCPAMNENPVYLFGPLALACRQSALGEARGSWYTLTLSNDSLSYRIGDISTTFPNRRREYLFLLHLFIFCSEFIAISTLI